MKSTFTTVVLLTDFGTSDHYIGVMKGVILSRAPHVTIIDISHNVSPQNIDEAAYLLWTSYKYFPQRTIFVSVVDPGVGSKRKILCAVGHGYYFLAPDNGLLKYVLGDLQNLKIYSVTDKKYFLSEVSSTFHGRDIFASVCAHLAIGLDPSKLGKSVKPKTKPERFIVIDYRKRKNVKGRIIYIDRFGNLVTNFLPKRPIVNLKDFYIELDPHDNRKRTKKVIKDSYHTYADAPLNLPFLIVGSSGLIEISLKNGNVSEFLGVKQRSHITLHKKNA